MEKKKDQGQSPEVLHEVQGELTFPAAPGVLVMQPKTSIRAGLMASEVIRREMLSCGLDLSPGIPSLELGGPPIEERAPLGMKPTQKKRRQRMEENSPMASPRDLDSPVFEARFTPVFCFFESIIPPFNFSQFRLECVSPAALPSIPPCTLHRMIDVPKFTLNPKPPQWSRVLCHHTSPLVAFS